MPAAGNMGGAGFRSGALPIILLATDTGFAYQPKGETSIIGAGGLSLPLSALTQTSRPTTPFNSGAGIQETITGLNALGALVIGLGTNPDANIDPRQQLESISKLTGAINRTTTRSIMERPKKLRQGILLLPDRIRLWSQRCQWCRQCYPECGHQCCGRY